MTTVPTLVACSHGTRSPMARELVTALARAAAARLPGTDVVEMFVDVQQPELATALPALPSGVVVVPVFLSGGYHVHHDIRAAAAAHPDAAVTAPLGPDARLASLQLARLRDAGAEPGDAVVMAASASSDRRALADVARAAGLLGERWGAPVRIGYVGGAGIQVSEAVATARRHARRVVVSSYLLMPGHFHAEVEASGGDLTTGPLLSEQTPGQVVELLVRRYRQACAARAEAA